MANWELIKEEYCSGIPPRVLEAKHNIKANTISNRATREDWVKQKQRNAKKVAKSYQEQVKNVTDLALEALVNKLSEEKVDVQAIKAALDISGLKNSTSHLELDNGKFNLFFNQVKEKAEKLND